MGTLTPQKAVEYRNRYGVDGIMIGRASIGAPWVFREMKHYMATGELLPPPGMTERVAAAREHFEKGWNGKVNASGLSKCGGTTLTTSRAFVISSSTACSWSRWTAWMTSGQAARVGDPYRSSRRSD